MNHLVLLIGRRKKDMMKVDCAVGMEGLLKIQGVFHTPAKRPALV
jgi:hypothetical protein